MKQNLKVGTLLKRNMKKQYKIVLSDEAEKDFDSSYEYYACDNKIVADNFFKQLNNSLETISQNPLGFQKTYKNVRRYVMRKFPFVIYYQISNIEIRVIAIFHTSRNPKIWKKRFDENNLETELKIN